MDKSLTYSPSPHLKSSRTTKGIMARVCIALLPTCIAGVIFFGVKALLILLVSTLTAIISEYIYLAIQRKSFNEFIKKFDFTSCVTGMLVGLSIGSQTPLYVPVFASAFAIIVVKMIFGGTGNNLVNPAIAGRIFAFMSFTAVMAGNWLQPSISAIFGGNSVDLTTGATILTNILSSGNSSECTFSVIDLFLGTGVAGCIGETCKLAIIIGAIYLAFSKIINIIYPLIYIVVTGLFSVILNGFDFTLFLPTILTGGLMLGAFFMATDYTTTPNTSLGNVIYFVALGLVTAGLRMATQIEVVSFAILLMNLIVPLIDKFIINKPFGFKKDKKVKEGK